MFIILILSFMRQAGADEVCSHEGTCLIQLNALQQQRISSIAGRERSPPLPVSSGHTEAWLSDPWTPYEKLENVRCGDNTKAVEAGGCPRVLVDLEGYSAHKTRPDGEKDSLEFHKSAIKKVSDFWGLEACEEACNANEHCAGFEALRYHKDTQGKEVTPTESYCSFLDAPSFACQGDSSHYVAHGMHTWCFKKPNGPEVQVEAAPGPAESAAEAAGDVDQEDTRAQQKRRLMENDEFLKKVDVPLVLSVALFILLCFLVCGLLVALHQTGNLSNSYGGFQRLGQGPKRQERSWFGNAPQQGNGWF
jgi:hypothetical protein